ncbi:MAG: hypothetical protein ACPL7A_01350, partial [Anaerolineales bacterium]
MDRRLLHCARKISACVIAKERQRLKQSPPWIGDCFATLAMTVPDTSLRPQDQRLCHCEGAFVATEAISMLNWRLLRCARND